MGWDKAGAFPVARVRDREWPVLVAGQYGRMETTAGFVTLGDALADVIQFSGAPDSVTIAVETFDAIVQYQRRGRAAQDTVLVRAGQTFAPDVQVEIIRARNNTPGSNAIVQVIGKWLRRAPEAPAPRVDA